MLHKQVKAASTATDQGSFTAIAACYTVDRMDEQIMPGAFAKTISHWQSSGKQLPVHWDHEGDPESIIGYADPKAMREADEGLYVRGQLDLEGNEKARAAWRAMKNNAVGLSFGYLVTDHEEVDEVKRLKEIDLFEISVTPAPVNKDTRIMEMKSSTPTVTISTANPADSTVTIKDELHSHEQSPEDAEPLSEEEATTLRDGYKKLAIDLMALGVNPDVKSETSEPETSQEDAGDGEEKPIEEAAAEEPESPAKPAAQDPLRKAYDDLALELHLRGIELAEPPKPVVKKPLAEPRPLEEMRRESYELMLETLTGSKEIQ